MSLTNQIYLYSVATDSFYEPDEQAIHQRMLKMYAARAKLKQRLNGDDKKKNLWDGQWRLSAYNRWLAKEKEKLSEILNRRVEDRCIRKLNPNTLKDKNIIN